MRISKKFAALTMSLGLAVAGLTGISAMSDATTLAAEAAASCKYSVVTTRTGLGKIGYVLNNSCAYAAYWEDDKLNGRVSRHYGTFVTAGRKSALSQCYGQFVRNGGQGLTWRQVRFA